MITLENIYVIFLLFIAFLLLFSGKFKKISEQQETPEAEISTRGDKVLGAIFTIIILVFVVTVIFFFYWQIKPEREIVFCGTEWNNDVILFENGWKPDADRDGNCWLKGENGSMLGIRNLSTFSAVSIIPYDEAPLDFEFKVGELYMAGAQKGKPCRRNAPSAYEPYFSYDRNNGTMVNHCVEYFKPAQAITLSRSISGWTRALQLSIADNPLADMELGERKYEPSTGTVIFYSSRINIVKIKIYCDMRCRGERVWYQWL